MRRLLLPSLLVLAGCPFTPNKGPARPPDRADNAAKATVDPTAPKAHDQRLGWIHWQSPTELHACTRRLDDNGNSVGVLGPCFEMEVGDSAPKKMVDWLTGAQADDTPLTHTPDPRCTLELRDAQSLPTPVAARLSLVAPSGRTLITEWLPAPDPHSSADLFVLEPTYSPDGRTLAIVRLGIGLGEGERSVEVAGITLSTAPACH